MIFDFDNEDLKIINAALIEAPYKYAAPLIAKINKQIQDAHNANLDKHDMPNGATSPKNEFTGD
jgi:hypothetical protein